MIYAITKWVVNTLASLCEKVEEEKKDHFSDLKKGILKAKKMIKSFSSEQNMPKTACEKLKGRSKMMKKVIVMTLVCLMAVSCLVSPACADQMRTVHMINYSVQTSGKVGYLDYRLNGAIFSDRTAESCLGTFTAFSKETEIKKVDTFTIEEFRFEPFFEYRGQKTYYDLHINIIPEYFGCNANKVFDSFFTKDGVMVETFAIYKDDGSMVYGVMREDEGKSGRYHDFLMIYATGLKKNEKHLKILVDEAMFNSVYSVESII